MENKMTKKHPDYIATCPACNESVLLGLTFEETHSTHKPGFIETDNGYIPSLHTKPHSMWNDMNVYSRCGTQIGCGNTLCIDCNRKMSHVPKRGPVCPGCGSGDTTMQYHPAGDEAYCDGCGLVWHVTKK